eukprot:4738939-Amphidinium_carterae.2
MLSTSAGLGTMWSVMGCRSVWDAGYEQSVERGRNKTSQADSFGSGARRERSKTLSDKRGPAYVQKACTCLRPILGEGPFVMANLPTARVAHKP